MRMRNFRNIIGLILSLMIVFSSCAKKDKIHVYGNESNDIVSVLKKQNSIEVIHYSSPLEAVDGAKEGDGVLILADEYPLKQVDLGSDFYAKLAEKKLRAYVEFPTSIPNVTIKGVEKAKHERAVVNSSMFKGEADSLSIVSVNGLNYLTVDAVKGKEHIVAARVGGFDYAIYGLPETKAPVLFELNDQPVLVATTNLSGFVSGRYAPAKEWAGIWSGIIRYVLPEVDLQPLEWDPVVTTQYAKEGVLPVDYQKNSVRKGIEWYKTAKMLPHESYSDSIQKLIDADIQKLGWNADIPLGDGSEGLFECIFSEIDDKGNQPIGIVKRGDCISEASMAFAVAGQLLENQEYKQIAENLLDFYLFKSSAMQKEYGDPKHPAYGLIPWGVTNFAWYKASYGDDNARFLLAAWVTAALNKSDRWDDVMMKSLLALLRTTGKEGFRDSRIDLPDLEKKGWKYYYNRDIINLAPHFECYLWACYLWAYDKTKDERFKAIAVRGIKTMMAGYPDEWKWTNGLAQERARMLLPLAWLVRVDNSDENKAMLMQVVDGVLALQDDCGAIREELGKIEMGRYPPPQSNEAYGTTEASLIAKNGDKVSDLLYTTNFALLGLHEAAYATGDPKIKASLEKLIEFLCRIQVKSQNHPELEGGWMRAFDYERFEHWGSNADHGWGAWAIETGWTQGWIVGILGLKELDKSIWDLTQDSQISKNYETLKKEMLP